MPAIGTHAALAGTRAVRLVGLVVALLFIASVGTAYGPPVAAKDWTPQIQATRRAQLYWEGVMRSADRQLRSLKQARKQTQRRLKSVKAKRTRAVARRSAAMRKHRIARAELRQASRALRPATPKPPLPSAPPAVPASVIPSALPFLPLTPPEPLDIDGGPEPPEVERGATEAEPVVDGRTVKKLERQAKKAKRASRQAKRKARRSARHVRVVQQRLGSIRAAKRSVTARRESAERSLGAWIVAMSKYGRIRASRKPVRPGINSSFAWPVRGRISQSYHGGHDGIDIVRYAGAPVRSMAYGVVTFVGWNPWDQHRRAFMVVITHAGGYETLYGHLQPRRIVRVGQEIRKGQVIGYMGNTGNSTGPHLHLELRRGRTTLNPLGVL